MYTFLQHLTRFVYSLFINNAHINVYGLSCTPWIILLLYNNQGKRLSTTNFMHTETSIDNKALFQFSDFLYTPKLAMPIIK